MATANLNIFSFISYLIIFHSPYQIAYELVYHTENSKSLQYYDCIYYTSNRIDNIQISSIKAEIKQNILNVKYCRQLLKTTSLRRHLFSLNSTCYHGGVLLSFSQLKSQNISATDVLKFSSSIERADKYAIYLLNATGDDGEDDFLCNCTRLGTFGKFCEYQFYYNSLSFDQAITKQFESGQKSWEGSQYHNNRPCYTTLVCDSGLMCLDWRNICDGQQHCMDGIDEDYCDKLEYNECEDDEYRCSNGMCIPGEYWLDSDYDCMDWSDETGRTITNNNGRRCISSPNFDCDEHLCLSDAYSCGDGQCLPQGSRFSTGGVVPHYCLNLRDINYMCELGVSYGHLWWTINGGYCSKFPASYFGSGWDKLTDVCGFFIKCALTQGLDLDCNCKSFTDCGELVRIACETQASFYPSQGDILTPYLRMAFDTKRNWEIKAPDYVSFFEGARLKCSGYQAISHATIVMFNMPTLYSDFYKFKYINHHWCSNTPESHRNYSGPQYDKDCWANSMTFTKRHYQVYKDCPHGCFSKYRVRDGIFDCVNSNHSEELLDLSCPLSYQRYYRFHCSSCEPSCLMPLVLGNIYASCINQGDEVTPNGLQLTDNVYCWRRNDEGCLFLQDYIRQSSNIPRFNNTNSHNQNVTAVTTIKLSFQYFCDSFFNTDDGLDESNELCQQWICRTDQYQCLSGQCIPLAWICDGEWDCSDASDEQRLFIMNKLNNHNIKIKLNLKQLKSQCHQKYRLNNTAFSTVCNISFEFPCFRRDAIGNNLFNFTTNRPCINISQIGDGITDCIGGADEKNILKCNMHSDMLGYSFLLSNGACTVPNDVCLRGEYYHFRSSSALDTVCFHRRQPGILLDLEIDQCGFKTRDSDVVCFNNTCIRDARCNGVVQCPMGEDEYWCDINNPFRENKYRSTKSSLLSSSYDLHSYPVIFSDISTFKIEISRLMSTNDQSSKPKEIQLLPKLQNQRNVTFFDVLRVLISRLTIENYYLPFICNRGLAIKNELNETVCLCPPSFYGELCEYYSDRITIITHFDLKNYRRSLLVNIIKVLSIFLFEDRIIDSYEFHVNPSLQTEENYIKQKIYFLYQRSEEFLSLKHNNRSGTQLYSVRFEAFELYSNQSIIPLAVWQYPIYFDFLPSFRLSKILRIPSEQIRSSNNPCSHRSCNMHGRCLPISNHNSTYFCSCIDGYYGTDCQDKDIKCVNHCSANSICKPNYDGILTGGSKPYCLCPLAHYGPTCALKNDQCSKNPCKHDGTCYMTYDSVDMQNYTCICTHMYYGINCEILKATVTVIINSTYSPVTAIATTIQYYDINSRTRTELILRNQLLFNSIPQKILYFHDQLISPIIGIVKLYDTDYLTNPPTYYLGYVQQNLTYINVTNNLQSKCSHVQSLWHLLPTNISKSGAYNSTTAVFSYHRLCQSLKNVSNSTISFRDNNYLCICVPDFSRVECFRFDPSSDHCSYCLANGLCLRDGLMLKKDFKCFCPRCHHGHLCQFLNELMSFTLDSLITKDIQTSEKSSVGIYSSIVVLIVLIGLFNNLCSFLTFIRTKPRTFGVGNYLLIVSIVDQCSLLLLMMKVIHIILSSNGTLFYYESLNLYSCKVVSYLLSVMTRITYWLTSLVTIERLCMVLFPTSIIFKKSKVALGLSIFVILTVGGMHIHEILYYMTIVDPSYISVNVTLCVTNYNQTFISRYNRINVLVHYFAPFFIQIISITMLILQITRSRARASNSNQQTFVNLFKKQLKTQKELYITPMIIILSSLPQIILSFSYACTELKQSWQRYTLLTTYFLSYLPQILGFILYVLPSTTFKEEFHQTIIGKRLIK